jgi:hypothetical protein
MNLNEYKTELKEINRRFDGQIAQAERAYKQAVDHCQKEQESFDAWLENYHATRYFHPLTGLAQRYEAVQNEVGGRRAHLDKARAAEQKTLEDYQALLANKRSWVVKLDNRFRETYLAEATAAAELDLTRLVAT